MPLRSVSPSTRPFVHDGHQSPILTLVVLAEWWVTNSAADDDTVMAAFDKFKVLQSTKAFVDYVASGSTDPAAVSRPTHGY